jgi:hypothetical protein
MKPLCKTGNNAIPEGEKIFFSPNNNFHKVTVFEKTGLIN